MKDREAGLRMFVRRAEEKDAERRVKDVEDGVLVRDEAFWMIRSGLIRGGIKITWGFGDR